MWPVRCVVLLNSASLGRASLGCLHLKAPVGGYNVVLLPLVSLSLINPLKVSSIYRSSCRARSFPVLSVVCCTSCWGTYNNCQRFRSYLKIHFCSGTAFLCFHSFEIRWLCLAQPSGVLTYRFSLPSFQLQSITMAAKEIAAADPMPSQPDAQTTSGLPVRPSPQFPSSASSPASDDSPKVEWHVCPHCKAARRTNSKKALEKSSTSSSSSPTTSDLSNARSTSFARLGHKIKDVFSLGPESLSTATEKRKPVKKKPQKNKPKKPKVVLFEKGYEELGADHWADDY